MHGPLSASELRRYRKLLLQRGLEILEDLQAAEEELASDAEDAMRLSTHPADLGTDVFEQDLLRMLNEGERERLREVIAALERIDEGTYGICERTGKQIPRARLEAEPCARYTIERERGRVAG